MNEVINKARFELGIVIPTYNEKENIHTLLGSIEQALAAESFATMVLIVDDGSPDGTGDIVQKYIDDNTFGNLNLKLMRREGKQGLASAYIQGFSLIKDDCIFVMSMDADMSHNPGYVPQMFSKAKSGYDCVVGSRYVNGGGIEGWGPQRLLISRLGSLYAQLLLFSPIKDQTGGFNLYRVSSLNNIDYKGIKVGGYMFQIEMKYLFRKNKMRIVEHPIVFVDRVLGKSKINRKIVIEAFFRVPLLRLGL